MFNATSSVFYISKIGCIDYVVYAITTRVNIDTNVRIHRAFVSIQPPITHEYRNLIARIYRRCVTALRWLNNDLTKNIQIKNSYCHLCTYLPSLMFFYISINIIFRYTYSFVINNVWDLLTVPLSSKFLLLLNFKVIYKTWIL